jgi:glycine/D-amino acid oxidase-like deaminating enzyme
VSRSPDVAIVGAGIVGAACALSLARRGFRVAVVEATFPGDGATAAGMGHLVAMDDSEAQFALTAASIGLWNELRPEMSDDCEWVATGTLWLAENEVEFAAARLKQSFYSSRGVAAELVTASDLTRIEPQLRPGLAGALRVPGDAVLYPPAAARSLLALARKAGARIESGLRVLSISGDGLVTDKGLLASGSVVVATGARAPELLAGVPIRPRKGHLVITDRAPGFCRHQLVELGYLKSAHGTESASVAFNLQPRRTGQLLIGSSREYSGFDASVDRMVLAKMLARAETFVPNLADLPALRTWTGFRPSTPDSLPLIGRWPATPNAWLAAGHEGLGITTAPATGKLLAELMAGARPDLDAAPYDPKRFANAESPVHA